MKEDIWCIWPDEFMCPIHELNSWMTMGNGARSDDYKLVKVTEYDFADLPSKWENFDSKNSNIVQIEWIKVDDSLPVIPEGRFSIPVLAVVFDSVYNNLSKGKGYFVEQISYGKVEWSNELDFYTLYICGKEGKDGSCFGPVGDRVTHWSYMPELPLELR